MRPGPGMAERPDAGAATLQASFEDLFADVRLVDREMENPREVIDLTREPPEVIDLTEEEDCVICMTAVEDGTGVVEKIRGCRCTKIHPMHVYCFEEWRRRDPTVGCLICRHGGS